MYIHVVYQIQNL